MCNWNSLEREENYRPLFFSPDLESLLSHWVVRCSVDVAGIPNDLTTSTNFLFLKPASTVMLATTLAQKCTLEVTQLLMSLLLSLALELLKTAISKAGYTDKVVIGMDVAASEFYRDGKYDLDFKSPDDPSRYITPDQLADLYKGFVKNYPGESQEMQTADVAARDQEQAGNLELLESKA